MEQRETGNNSKYAFSAFMAVVLFTITYKYVLNAVAYDGINDLREHMWHAESIYLDRLGDAWLKRPYLFWHLCVKSLIKFASMPVNHATACTCGIFAAFNFFVSFFMIDRLVGYYKRENSGIVSGGIAAALCFSGALYVEWVQDGRFSINPIYNPTQMAVKPFGLLSFLFAVDLILRYKGEETIFCKSKWAQSWGGYLLFGGALFLSTVTKPTFMYMLVPAGIVYLLIELVIALIKKDGSYKKVWGIMWRMACACIPSLIYLLLEYAAFYVWGGTNDDASVAIYPFLTAWHILSPSVRKSIIYSMAFPLWMILTNMKYFIQSVEGRLSVIGYVVGTLEFSFFVETGEKLEHLNFAWPMMSGMLLLWVIAGAKLAERTCDHVKNWKNTVVISVGWILLIIHVFSGLYYINPYQYII